MGNGPIVIMLNRAIDIWLYNRWAALHDLACVHTALSSICGAPVHPGTPGKYKGKKTTNGGQMHKPSFPKSLTIMGSLVSMQRI